MHYLEKDDVFALIPRKWVMERSRELRSPSDEENAEKFQPELREPGKAFAAEGEDWPRPAGLPARRSGAQERKGALIFRKSRFFPCVVGG